MNSSERMAAFETSCHLYRVEINEVTQMKQKNLDPVESMTLRILEDDIKFVEDTFEKIKEECGRHARLLMWMSLVEEKKRSDIAESYDISERTLTAWFEKWKEKIFGGGVLIFSTLYYGYFQRKKEVICDVMSALSIGNCRI